MVEKFGYRITTTDKIKIYRLVGELNPTDGSFNPDYTKITSTHLYDIKYKIMSRRSSGERSRRYYNGSGLVFDTRVAAETEAKAALTQSLINRIKQAKIDLQYQEDTFNKLNDMKIVFHNCGGQ